MKESLKIVSEELAEHTEQECRNCRGMGEFRCCDRIYCEQAMELASHDGIELKPTGHLTLPMMGSDGCIAHPAYRPICTAHQCGISSVGFAVSQEWTDEYFRLRESFEEALWEDLEECYP